MEGHPKQPINKRPYGNVHAGPSGPASSFEEAALHRAQAKLAAVRGNTSGDAPVGYNYAAVIPLAVLSAIPGLLFLVGAVAMLTDKRPSPGGAAFFGFMALFFLAMPVLGLLTSRPDSPKRALKQFYRDVGRGKHERALKLVTNADKDGFQRRQPQIGNLGQPSGYPFQFANKEQFAGFWNELLRTHPLPYCFARLSNVSVTEHGPDVAIVEYDLTLTMNTQLWFMLILIAWIIALIVDLATRKVVKVRLRKVLVKVGDEWKLFNGEWQGYEEMDLRWLGN